MWRLFGNKRSARQHGWQIHVHNNGDAGMDVLLGELEKAMARKPRQDHRTVVVHFGFARPEQIDKWVKLGGIVSSTPYYVTALAGRYGNLGMTELWAQNMVPHAYVLKNGGSPSFHSDMPMAPAKPMQLVWAGVNRLTYEGDVAGPQHKVSLDTALKAMTIDAAYSIQQEKKVGSIEVGKDANFTVLEQSPYAVVPAKLKDIKVWDTMLEGRVQPVPAVAGKGAQAKPRSAASGGGAAHVVASAAPAAARTDSDRAATREEFWYQVRLTRSRIANELGNCSEPGAMIAGLASAIAAQQAREAGSAHTAQVAGR